MSHKKVPKATDEEDAIVNAIAEKTSLYRVGGGKWLRGRVLDSRPRGSGFEPHLCHCVVVLEQDTFFLA